MNDRTKAALIGGIIAGVLSGIPFIGGCCFLWALGGGFLAVFMYMKNAPGTFAMGDGAKLGATAGVIGAVIATVIRIPLMLLGVGMSAMGGGRDAGTMAGFAAATGVVGIIFTIVVVVGFAVLGGVIGVAVLGRNRPGGVGTPPPPPPSDFGTGTGGYTPPPAS
ncbi:MAG: hypothetical protein ABR563_00040 [Pyrinomonadaceae bacterium]